jgi:hypothetical protein
MPAKVGRVPPRAWPDLAPDPGSLRASLDLTQAQMAAALGVTVNTWARCERRELAIHSAYQLLLDYLEARTDRDADRTAARLRSPGGVRNLWCHDPHSPTPRLLHRNGVVLGARPERGSTGLPVNIGGGVG